VDSLEILVYTRENTTQKKVNAEIHFVDLDIYIVIYSMFS